MPALDHCHEQVVRAIEKDGWQVDPGPYSLSVTRMHSIHIDIEAHRTSDTGETILLIEVKCFPFASAPTTELYVSIGQYIVYRSLLRQLGIEATLFLSVPRHAFDDVIARMAVRAIAENEIKMIVIDLDTETVEQWIT